jgi:hypothetical protein
MGLFGGGGERRMARQMQAQAQAARADAAASLAAANLDSESSRRESERRMRRAGGARGFADTIFGAMGAPPATVAAKQLMGQ